MKFGVNSVLFGGFDMPTAFRCIAMAGYDGVLSIEHEDSLLDPLLGVRKSVDLLRNVAF